MLANDEERRINVILAQDWRDWVRTQFSSTATDSIAALRVFRTCSGSSETALEICLLSGKKHSSGSRGVPNPLPTLHEHGIGDSETDGPRGNVGRKESEGCSRRLSKLPLSLETRAGGEAGLPTGSGSLGASMQVRSSSWELTQGDGRGPRCSLTSESRTARRLW
jgi:hypothetical protein